MCVLVCMNRAQRFGVEEAWKTSRCAQDGFHVREFDLLALSAGISIIMRCILLSLFLSIAIWNPDANSPDSGCIRLGLAAWGTHA